MEAAYDNFCPNGVPAREKVIMTMDEYETIRLVDLEKCTHEQCAKQMGIARTTVTEIYESARYKMADSIVNGKTLRFQVGIIDCVMELPCFAAIKYAGAPQRPSEKMIFKERKQIR